MSDFLIEVAELIYPDNFNKQIKLMKDIVCLGTGSQRLTEFTPTAFRKAYEKSRLVPLLPVSHLEDMAYIMGKKL